MAKLIHYKPTTPARRHAGVIKLEKPKVKAPNSLLIGKRSKAGRNNTGKITVRHKGAGVKKADRLVDMKREKMDVPAKVMDIHYDPNRTAHLALLSYADGDKRYIIAPNGLKIGDSIVTSKKSIPVAIGNRIRLADIPAGQQIHAIELTPGSGAKLIRSAGSSAILMNVEGQFAQIKLPSGEVRLLPKDCMATIGQTSNIDHRNRRFGKAGRMRHKGIRPLVTGKSMNPVDHPHGGGEGHQPVGLKGPKDVWGKKAYGVRTRRTGKTSDKLIIIRRVRKNA